MDRSGIGRWCLKLIWTDHGVDVLEEYKGERQDSDHTNTASSSSKEHHLYDGH